MFPSAIYKTSEGERTAIVVMVGLDVDDTRPKSEQLELSIMYLAPQSTSDINKSYTVVTALGENVSDCLSSLEAKTGKRAGLSHCALIIISDTVAQNGAMQYLDFFTRTNNLSTNSLLVVSETPKELLQAQQEESNSLSISLQNILDYNQNHQFTLDIDLESFHAQYFDEASTSFLPIINVKSGDAQESGEGGGSSNNESGANSNSSNANSPDASSESTTSDQTTSSSGAKGPAKLEIVNSGEVAVMQRGTMTHKMSQSQVEAMNLFSDQIKKGSITINNYSSHSINNADFVVELTQKSVSYSYFFADSRPVFRVSLNAKCKLSEIAAHYYSIDSISIVDTQITDSFRNVLIDKIAENYTNLINWAKSNNIDLFGLTKQYYRLYSEDWTNYLSTIPDTKNPIDDMLFLIDVKLIDNG